MSQSTSGAKFLAEFLENSGVTTVFTLSGNQVMPVFDACIDTGIRLVHARQEAATVYMAEAWAQATGETGVALVAAGPGFANAVSPLFSARQSESPLVLISGDSPLSQDKHVAFQALDQVAMTSPLVKLAKRVANAAEFRVTLVEAFRVAQCGRPGPVHIAIPFDMLTGEESIDVVGSVAADAIDQPSWLSKNFGWPCDEMTSSRPYL